MAYLRAEEVLVPLRFLFLTCHFVALLATAFGLSYSASHITLVNPADPKTTAADNDEYNRVQRTLSIWNYVALGCGGAEYVSMLLGASLFIHFVQLMDILAHVCGVILVVLWYYNSWSVGSFIAYVVVFSILPIAIELLILAFMSRFSFARY